ncbi:sperm-associated antigen 17 isoform X2 [Festucalex cinctus]
MAPKAAKKGAAAKKTAAAQGPEVQTWESGLASAQFEEDNWKACVCMLVGRDPHDEELIRTLAQAVQQPQRKLFTALAWEDTEAKIREYGNPKVKKRDAFPQYYEVTQPARELLEAREKISAELMAQIVKFMLLQIKEKDHLRRKAEQAAAAPAAKEKAGAKGKDKNLKDEAPPKPKTKLKRRDDVEPPKYINDEPIDGPQHYVLLLGFHQPQLVGTLDGAGVHVDNVIGLSAPHAPCDDEHQEQDEEIRVPSADQIAAEEARAAQAEVLDNFWAALKQVLDNGGANSRLHNVAQLEYAVPDSLTPFDPQDPEAVVAVATRMFDGVANLIYDCLDWRRQHQHYLDSVTFVRVPSVLSGQDVPQPAESGATVSPRSKKSGRPAPSKKAPSSLTTDVDMNHYSGLLEHVPAEACSVPLILHCMLEQVVLTSEQAPPPQAPDDSEPQTAPGLDNHVVGQMLHNILPQVEAEDERRDLLHCLLTTVEREDDKEILKGQFGVETTPRRSDQPVIIRHHDERALRLIGITGIQGLDLAHEESSMMTRSPEWKLINSVAQRRSNSSCWMAIKQQLQRQCTDDEVSWPLAERFFHQSVFESMLLTGLNEEGVLGKDCKPLGMVHHSKKHPINPWDNPLSFAKQKLRSLRKKCLFIQSNVFNLGSLCHYFLPLIGPKILEEDTDSAEMSERQVVQLDLSDIQSCRLRSFRDWHYVEHYEAAILPQVLQSAAQQYRCLDTLRGSHNNVLYIFCHNPMNPDRLCKEFWDIAIHTDVKFRTYLENVASKIRDWIEKEELKRQPLDISPVQPCEVEAAEPQEPYVTKNSLKASKLEEERLKEEESKKGKKPAKAPAAKKPQPTEEVKSPEAKKSDKSGNTVKSKTNTDSSMSTDHSDQSHSSKADDIDEGFTGFHMDGMLVHLSGCVQYIFPASGGNVTVETISYVGGSSMLKVAVKKDGHHFYTHINQDVHAVRNDVKEHPVKTTAASSRSFSALLDNGVRLSYTFEYPPEKYKVPVETLMETENGAQESTALVAPAEGLKETEKEPQEPTEFAAPVENLKETDEGPQESAGGELVDDPYSGSITAEAPLCESQPQVPLSPLNSLSLSVPSGLLVQFMREDEKQDMLVRLSFHATGDQEPFLAKEASRTITSQGAVIRYMRDGSSEVLFADGAVSSSLDSGPVWVQEIEEDTTDEQNPENQVTSPQQGFWETTTPCGTRICTVGSKHEQNPTCSVLTYKTSDPVTHEVMLSREDLVVTVQKPDGSVSVDHADGTRITTFYQDRPPSVAEEGCETQIEEEKERVLVVENEACATVVMYPERHVAEIWLADGTVITGNDEGVYEVIPSSIGVLNIQSDGKCIYSSRPPQGGLPSYVMSHTDKVACDITDLDGSHFQVLEDGQVTTHVVGPPPRMLRVEQDEDKEIMSKPRDHCPRLFLVHEDGSGSELFSRQAVEELLHQAHLDPTVVLLKDPLPDAQGEFGITILKPTIENVRSKWVHVKLEHDAIHLRLQKHSGQDSPRVEVLDNMKSRSPSFVTTAGQGYSPGKRAVASVHVRNCPKVLEIRELYQHTALDRRLKNLVDTRLKEYIESLIEKSQWSADVMLKEPRTEVEQAHAGFLLSQSLPDEADEACTNIKRTLGDISSLYRHAAQAPVELLDDLTDTMTTASIGSAQYKESKWADTLEQYRQELFEVRACVEALRKKIIVPYFHPENNLLHQNYPLCQSPDIKRPVLSSPTFSESDYMEEAFRRDVQPEEQLLDDTVEPPPPQLHPTPYSTSHTAVRSSRMPGMSPPVAAGTIPAVSFGMDSRKPPRSVQVNVTGQPRWTSIRLPPSVIRSKPFSVPNHHFRSVEEPVRRRCRTISLVDPNVITRGFELRPSSIDFGLQKDGTFSVVTVVMKNVGVDTCRFHVKQPPISSGLRVKYQPGPVPAGLHIELEIELYAMCEAHESYEDPTKYISHDIIIPTETDILYLPVTATILPELFYDIWMRDHFSSYSRRRSRAPKQSRSLPACHGRHEQNPPGSRGLTTTANTGHHKRTASL